MSNKNSHIDQLFKESLKDHTLQTTDMDWAVIENGLQNKKHRFPFLWLWVTLGTLLLSFSIYLFLGNDFSTKESTNIQIAGSEIHKKEHAPRVDSEKRVAQYEDQSVSSPVNPMQANTNPTATKTETGALSEFAADQASGSSTIDDTNQEKSAEDVVRRPPYQNIAVAPKEGAPFLYRLYLPSTPVSNYQSVLAWPKQSPHVYSWQVGLELGSTQGQKVTQTSKAEQADFVQRSNGAEGTSSLSFGAYVGYQWKRIQISSGATYSKLQFADPKFTYMIYDSFPLLDPQGKLIGYGRRNYRDTVENNQKSSISSIQIPLTLSYQVFQSPKLSLSLGLQGNLLMNLSQSGFTVNSELLRVASSTRYSNLVNVQCGGNARIQYLLTDRLRIAVGTTYLRQINSLESRPDFSTKLHQFSLNSGVYYAF